MPMLLSFEDAARWPAPVGLVVELTPAGLIRATRNVMSLPGLLYLHFDDPETPVEEPLSALDELVRAGNACPGTDARRRLMSGRPNDKPSVVPQADRVCSA
jgi:hypothetical protein